MSECDDCRVSEIGVRRPGNPAIFRRDKFASFERPRGKIISAAIRLLNHGGRDAVTTRAVADAAGVQAPTIYRLFGDKGGLLDAVAEYGFAAYLKGKKVRKLSFDPVENLRAGWVFTLTLGCPIQRSTRSCTVIRNQERALLPQLKATGCCGSTFAASPRQAGYG